ncbi:hypothetical protein ACJ7VE_30610 [Streptomyces sp. PB17]
MISPQRSAGELPGAPGRLSLAYRTWQFVGSAGGLDALAGAWRESLRR